MGPVSTSSLVSGLVLDLALESELGFKSDPNGRGHGGWGVGGLVRCVLVYRGGGNQ